MQEPPLQSFCIPFIQLSKQPATQDPNSVEELYELAGSLLHLLDEELPNSDELKKDSFSLRSSLLVTVESLEQYPGAERAGLLTLRALSQGMFSGVLDGANLFKHEHRAPVAEVTTAHQHLLKPLSVFSSNLEQVLTIAQDNWSQAHVDDLQLLSGYGRYSNLQSVEEGQKLPEATAQSLQVFLLATYKGGYAMGVADAAVRFVGNEQPGQQQS